MRGQFFFRRLGPHYWPSPPSGCDLQPIRLLIVVPPELDSRRARAGFFSGVTTNMLIGGHAHAISAQPGDRSKSPQLAVQVSLFTVFVGGLHNIGQKLARAN